MVSKFEKKMVYLKKKLADMSQAARLMHDDTPKKMRVCCFTHTRRRRRPLIRFHRHERVEAVPTLLIAGGGRSRELLASQGNRPSNTAASRGRLMAQYSYRCQR